MRDEWKFMNDRLDYLQGLRNSILFDGRDVPDELTNEIEHLQVILNR